MTKDLNFRLELLGVFYNNLSSMLSSQVLHLDEY